MRNALPHIYIPTVLSSIYGRKKFIFWGKWRFLSFIKLLITPKFITVKYKGYTHYSLTKPWTIHSILYLLTNSFMSVFFEHIPLLEKLILSSNPLSSPTHPSRPVRKSSLLPIKSLPFAHQESYLLPSVLHHTWLIKLPLTQLPSLYLTYLLIWLFPPLYQQQYNMNML